MRTKKLSYVLPIYEQKDVLAGMVSEGCNCTVITDNLVVVAGQLIIIIVPPDTYPTDPIPEIPAGPVVC